MPTDPLLEHSDTHATPIQALLGRPGDPVECKVFSEDVAMHWFPSGAQPGERCLCGETTMSEPE